MTPGRTALVALLGLLAALVVAGAVLTPWRPLQASGAQRVAPDVSRDFSAEEVASGADYRSQVRLPGLLGTGLSLLAVLALGLSPVGARLVERAARPVGAWPLRVVVGALVLAAVLRLVTLPTAAWARSVGLRFGTSTQGWGAWAADVARAWLLSTALLTVTLLVIVGLARRWPDSWWLPAGALAAVAVVAASYLFPVLVEPIFNRFTPMPDSPLRTSLVELAERDGQPVDEVLVADASRRTTAANAYVSGFGSTRRLVVHDTLLEQTTPAEVRAVVAHELGHTKHRDVLTGTLLGALGAAAGVVALFLLLRSGWLLERSGASGPGDPRVLALLLALVAVGGALSTPVQSAVSRQVERRADVHALDLTRQPDVFVDMQRRLALVNRSDVDPPRLLHAWFGTHPTAPERIAAARTWARVHGEAVP